MKAEHWAETKAPIRLVATADVFMMMRLTAATYDVGDERRDVVVPQGTQATSLHLHNATHFVAGEAMSGASTST
jgi:hypothetical protein